jgi:hypothetical protein
VQVHAEIPLFISPISASAIVPRRAAATTRWHVCDHSFTEHLERIALGMSGPFKHAGDARNACHIFFSLLVNEGRIAT